jgi:glycosyltransferase involved in cell wall biosynthesis
MDKGYIRACKEYKQNYPKVKIIAGIDDQWTGSLHQRFGQIYYAIFLRRLFDFMWVSGKPQFSFAQRFGYGIENILSNLYSADNKRFNSKAGFQKRFVYVGRFVAIKALDLLVEAYCRLPQAKQEEWPLVLIGDGDQKEMILSRQNPNINVLPFMQPVDLNAELLKGGVACLPSHKDQWGVVVHEYALMGLPMLLSSGCGAASEFLIPGHNGFMFSRGDVNSLHSNLLQFTELRDADIQQFGINSTKLGARINNEISAKSLLSAVYL